jgi:hypothetical protein
MKDPSGGSKGALIVASQSARSGRF